MVYRLIAAGSEWRLHRQRDERSAMGDLLGENLAVAHSDTLDRCLRKLLACDDALCAFREQRWSQLFAAGFQVLLRDLSSTRFECDPPESGNRKVGCSHNRRFDCAQLVIALIVIPESLGPGLTRRSAPHHYCAVEMVDVHRPIDD